MSAYVRVKVLRPIPGRGWCVGEQRLLEKERVPGLAAGGYVVELADPVATAVLAEVSGLHPCDSATVIQRLKAVGTVAFAATIATAFNEVFSGMIKRAHERERRQAEQSEQAKAVSRNRLAFKVFQPTQSY
ncbi:MAG TPA: hypothetical protein VH643_29315 [Gemmataceae bacterium]|jgi:hypothetical protein